MSTRLIKVNGEKEKAYCDPGFSLLRSSAGSAVAGPAFAEPDRELFQWDDRLAGVLCCAITTFFFSPFRGPQTADQEVRSYITKRVHPALDTMIITQRKECPHGMDEAGR